MQNNTQEEGLLLSGSNITIPRLGLGTWAWGDSSTWGMNGYDRSYNFSTIQEAYETSISLGVTLLDTAEGYGRGESERIIGRLLANNPAYRAKAILATKFWPAPWKLRVKEALLTSLKKSLERLQVQEVDLYQIHGPISLRSHQAMADALAAAKESGLTKAVGVSNYSEKELRAIHAALKLRGVSLATNQIEFSLLRTKPEKVGLLRACKELGVVVLAYSPIGQGRLTGRYSAQNPPPGRRHFSDYPMSELEPLLEKLRRIGERYQKSPAQVALNWLICKGTVPIPGAKNKDQAAHNAGALGWRLSPDDVASLDSLAKYGKGGLLQTVWQHG